MFTKIANDWLMEKVAISNKVIGRLADNGLLEEFFQRSSKNYTEQAAKKYSDLLGSADKRELGRLVGKLDNLEEHNKIIPKDLAKSLGLSEEMALSPKYTQGADVNRAIRSVRRTPLVIGNPTMTNYRKNQDLRLERLKELRAAHPEAAARIAENNKLKAIVEDTAAQKAPSGTKSQTIHSAPTSAPSGTKFQTIHSAPTSAPSGTKSQTIQSAPTSAPSSTGGSKTLPPPLDINDFRPPKSTFPWKQVGIGAGVTIPTAVGAKVLYDKYKKDKE